MTRLPYWAWRPWLTPWHAATAWWYRGRPVRVPARTTHGRCCEWHGRNCEPPSELCCGLCAEWDHPRHRDGAACSSPDLSPNMLRDGGHDGPHFQWVPE